MSRWTHSRFETNLKQLAERRKKLLSSWTGNKELDGKLGTLCDGGQSRSDEPCLFVIVDLYFIDFSAPKLKNCWKVVLEINWNCSAMQCWVMTCDKAWDVTSFKETAVIISNLPSPSLEKTSVLWGCEVLGVSYDLGSISGRSRLLLCLPPIRPTTTTTLVFQQ